GKLAVCTGGRTIFLWTRLGASCVQVPAASTVASNMYGLSCISAWDGRGRIKPSLVSLQNLSGLTFTL
ncbi:MAG: hypothetical protein ACPIOQ_14490, partial [Promethearchaeia archaeon]